ncbi:MAG: hypothetical protein PHV35_09940, partial [Mariniphaga sp.]|nr:hypothetical protein [Mariniphaga sp.]
MKNIFLFYFISFFLIHLSLKGQDSHVYKTFQQGFQNPPPASHPNVVHWFLGGYIDTLCLKKELQDFKKAGISGVTIF